MKASIRKRLEAVEQSIGQNIFVCVYMGTPPIYVVLQRLGTCSGSETLVIETNEELESYLDSLPNASSVIIISSDNMLGNMSSEEAYSCSQ